MSHSVDDDQVDQPAPHDGDEQVLLMWPVRVRTLLNGPLWKGLAVAFGSEGETSAGPPNFFRNGHKGASAPNKSALPL
jgi:hypothetical protein